MFSSKSIGSFEYYLGSTTLTPDERQGLTRSQYYTDAKGEPCSIVWTPKLNDSEIKFRFGQDGTKMSPHTLRELGSGNDPATGHCLLGKAPMGNRKAAYDCTMSPPKSVSVLWCVSDQAQREKIEKCVLDAARSTLQSMFDEGIIMTRRGHAGSESQAVEDCIAALYLHHMNRAAEPDLHVHALLLNLCQSVDGKILSIDNVKMMTYQKALSNVFRSQLASNLQTDLGCRCIRLEKDMGFTIAGIPESVIDKFSTRRKDILAAVEAQTGSASTAGSHRIAQHAALATRASKNALEPYQFYDQPGQSWDQAIQECGWTKTGILQSVEQGAKISNQIDIHAANLNDMTVDEYRAYERKRLANQAVTEITDKSSTFKSAELRYAIAERLQCLADIEQINEVTNEIIEKRLQFLGYDRENQEVYTTPEMPKYEKYIVNQAISQQGTHPGIDGGIITQAIAKQREENPGRGVTVEQEEVIRHACGSDGIVIVNGGAGTGKSTAMKTFKAIEDVCSKIDKVKKITYTIAPSHKAKKSLQTDLKISDDAAAALAGFLNKLDSEAITLCKDSIIILDEAGMVPTHDLYRLISHQAKAQCKLVMLGDVRQLQAVAAGSPMKLMMEQMGKSSEITKVVRQNEAWMRACSEAFNSKEHEHKVRARAAFEEYDTRGFVHWCDSQEETLGKMLDKICKDMDEAPKESRVIIAATNRQCQIINNSMRQMFRNKRLITGDDYVLKSVGRGTQSITDISDVSIAKGERIVFGETLPRHGIINNDMATILDIKKGSNPNDPIVKIQLDDDKRILEVPWSSLIGYRDDSIPKSKCVQKISHAYAGTVFMSQGQTVDNTYWLYSDGKNGAETTLVAMTRHRKSCNVFVDKTNIREYLTEKMTREKSENIVKLHKSGQADTPELDDDPREQITPTDEQIKSAIIASTLHRNFKTNALDYCENTQAFLKGEEEFKFKEPENLNDTMRKGKGIEKWMKGSGGWNALSDDDKKSAQRAFTIWKTAKPERTYDLEQYVVYTQFKNANLEEKEKEETIYDDTRLWTNKPKPWVRHTTETQRDRIIPIPESSPITAPQLFAARMRERAQNPYPTPSLATVPLPQAIKHRAALATAAQQAAQQAQTRANVNTAVTPIAAADHLSAPTTHTRQAETKADQPATAAPAEPKHGTESTHLDREANRILEARRAEAAQEQEVREREAAREREARIQAELAQQRAREEELRNQRSSRLRM